MADVVAKEHFLVGAALEKLNDENLPITKDLIKNMAYNHFISKYIVHDSAKLTVESAQVIWKKHNIATKNKDKSIAKLKKEYIEWQGVVRNQYSNTNTQKQRREKLIVELEKVFDVETIPSKNKSVQTVAVDIRVPVEASTSSERVKRAAAEKSFGEISKKRLNLNRSSRESEESEDKSKSEDKFEPYYMKKPKKRFIDQRLVAALDARSISDNDAVHIISAVAQALGHSLSDLVISRSTIKRIRNDNRFKTSVAVKANFEVCFHSLLP